MIKYKRFAAALAVTLISFAGGCISKPEETMVNIPTTVSLVTNDSIYLIVCQPIDNTDDIADPSAGVLLTIGRYTLEAEDLTYRYFRAPKPLIIASYEFGQRRGGQRVNGGIAIPKDELAAGAQKYVYVDDKAKNGKIFVWRITDDFNTKRGQKWFLNTDKRDNAPAQSAP